MNKNDKKYFKEMIEDNDLFHVSIPMTVLGGLQLLIINVGASSIASFNTDDGIRRATTTKILFQNPENAKFQYR